jgi:hypothetical protein
VLAGLDFEWLLRKLTALRKELVGKRLEELELVAQF